MSPASIPILGDTAIAGSLGMAIATVHPVPSNRQMFGEDRGFFNAVMSTSSSSHSGS